MSAMDSSFECGQSPASPVIKRLRRMLCTDTEELMENFDDFSEFVKELNDYSWRLNKEEKRFLDSVLRLQKGLTTDASFVIAVENVKECHTERVDDRLDLLHKEMKPLLKRKRALQGEIRDDVTKLISRRRFLVDLLEKQKELGEDMKPIDANDLKCLQKMSISSKMT
ncbi:hypothetical protein L195_g050824 [Trifolium pratense]|uniref:Uncharacterized protein n=1 Tax=Trifolium pratense TaxID=57577 RepID=A0A2K3JW85_TRIPR|nr:hypothetical protein L195_g050824 [Trifolium pratense]